jgi:crotonobetainyl-CoA:carnitine CoA-transferase CaiB-like acyl-CoA transferase
VLAALRLRDRTGEGQHVEVTLQATGIWTLAGDVQAALVSRENPSRHVRTQPANPIWNSYQAKDGLWVLLVMPMPDPYWPKFCAAIGKPEWAADPRYDSLAKRRAHSVDLTKQIDAIFATQPRAEWARRLDAQDLIWAPVATLTDVIDDPQVREMGWFTELESKALGRFETLATPFKLYGADVGPRGAAPAAGEHTFEVLSGAGLTDEELAQLAADGVIG